MYAILMKNKFLKQLFNFCSKVKYKSFVVIHVATNTCILKISQFTSYRNQRAEKEEVMGLKLQENQRSQGNQSTKKVIR